MNHRRKSRKMQNSGRPEGCIERRGRTVEDSGKPGDLQPAAPKDAEHEETRSAHRRHSLETREAGKPAAGRKAERDDAWSDALRVHTIEAPETPVSGVFVCGRFVPEVCSLLYIRMRWRSCAFSLIPFSCCLSEFPTS